MKWIVTNALSRDIERQQLNKILADIRATCEDLAKKTNTSSNAVNMDALAQAVEGNVEDGIDVTYNNETKTLDFVVNSFTIRLSGDMTGEGIVNSLSSVTITTTIDPSKVGIVDAPLDGQTYWRANGDWEAVPNDIFSFLNLHEEGFPAQYQPSPGAGWQWHTREFEAAADELTIVNPTGKLGNVKYGLADLVDTGVGTSPIQLFTRDAKGRVEGTEAADTDDLPEGVTNLYFTDERAQDAVGTILADTSDIDLTYNDTTPAISGVLTAAIHASLSLADSSVQPGDNVSDLVNDAGYVNAAGAAAAAPIQSIVAGTNITVDITDPENPVINSSASGSGDVVGPASAVDGNVALYDGTTGKLIKDGGTLGTAAFDDTGDFVPIAHVGSGGTEHANAVASGAAGFMTGADKAKLDGVASGATAYTDTAARAAVITSSITNGDTTHSPSGDAVFDALALKADATSIPTYGSYTPTGSGITNVTSVTGQPCNWFRHGNTVFLDGRVDANPTAVGACVAFVSVPVASNFSAFTDASGVLVVAGTSITKASGTIIASIADDGFRFNFDGQGTGQHQLYFHASYTVI